MRKQKMEAVGEQAHPSNRNVNKKNVYRHGDINIGTPFALQQKLATKSLMTRALEFRKIKRIYKVSDELQNKNISPCDLR